MKLQADQARLQDLLKQTITLLCKNGLQFKKSFQVKALIGVSTDEDNTFVVDINETFGELDDEDNEWASPFLYLDYLFFKFLLFS